MHAGDLTSTNLGKTFTVSDRQQREGGSPGWVVRGTLVQVQHRLDGPPGQEGAVTVLVTLKVGPAEQEVSLALGELDSIG